MNRTPPTLAALCARHHAARQTITLHLVDLPDGSVAVSTNAPTPHPGRGLTPAQALATDLLAECSQRARHVWHWGAKDPAQALLHRLLDPECFAHAVTEEVREQARQALGIRVPIHLNQELSNQLIKGNS